MRGKKPLGLSQFTTITQKFFERVDDQVLFKPANPHQLSCNVNCAALDINTQPHDLFLLHTPLPGKQKKFSLPQSGVSGKSS